jgi:hypothetical protein
MFSTSGVKVCDLSLCERPPSDLLLAEGSLVLWKSEVKDSGMIADSSARFLGVLAFSLL